MVYGHEEDGHQGQREAPPCYTRTVARRVQFLEMKCVMRQRVPPWPLAELSASGGGTQIVIPAGGWSGRARDLALKTMAIQQQRRYGIYHATQEIKLYSTKKTISMA